jgi:3-oxocholest-4-en-26-oyl-CoA dehydrogenase beta subunit
MDFDLSEMQKMLRQSARDFLSTEYPEKQMREMRKDTRGYTDDLWQKMIELGWTGLSIPEEYGGMGDFPDLMVILQEMGRAGLISPYFATMVLGAGTIQAAGSQMQKQRYLTDIASGKAKLTLALLENSSQYTAREIQMQAIADKDGYRIEGRKLFVPYAATADQIILAARTQITEDPESGITLFMVDRRIPGLTCEPMETFDGDKLYQITCQNVRASKESILGESQRGWYYLKRIMATAAAARCAETLGACEKVLEMTITYAKERTAFGHPIGSFQTIQHRLADMLMDLEGSRYVTYKAGWLIGAGLPGLKESAIAKTWVGQISRRMINSAHQIHGAIGFTEDHVLHLYTKRIRANDFSFGDADHHLNVLAGMTGE